MLRITSSISTSNSTPLGLIIFSLSPDSNGCIKPPAGPAAGPGPIQAIFDIVIISPPPTVLSTTVVLLNTSKPPLSDITLEFIGIAVFIVFWFKLIGLFSLIS